MICGLLLVTGKLRVRGWTKSGLCASKLVLLSELKEEPHNPTLGSESGGCRRTGTGGDVKREPDIEQLIQRLSSLTINTVNSRNRFFWLV